MPYCMGSPTPEVATLREPPCEAYFATSYDARAEIVGEADGRMERARRGPPADARSEGAPMRAELMGGDAKADFRSAVQHDPSVLAPCGSRNREL